MDGISCYQHDNSLTITTTIHHHHQIEQAVSKAVFEQEKKLRDAGYAMHQSMKGISADRLKWGYKITYKPLEEKVRGSSSSSSSRRRRRRRRW